MTTDNAVLERVLSDADPARTPRDAAPDAPAIAMREKILRTTDVTQRTRTRAFAWGSGFVAAAASVVIAMSLLTPPQGAVADTPTPLVFSDAGTVEEIVDAANADLSAAPGPAAPERVVRSASWTFSLDEEKVMPLISELTWNADLSGAVTVYAGVPYEPTDAVSNSRVEVESSGEVTTNLVMAAGEFGTPVPDPPGDTRDDMISALRAFGMPGEPNAFEVVTATTALLEQWTLTNAQHSELLALIEEAGGVDALGTSTDRLGRPVVGMRMISRDGAASDVVLVSAETGRIVGLETTALKDVTAAPVGAVTGYRMWGLDEEAMR